MLRPGSVFDGRFRVLENFATAANSIALAEELNGGRRVWLVLLSVTATAAQVSVILAEQSRFGVGVPGLARPIASGVDAGLAFVAFAAPEAGSVAATHTTAWDARRVSVLAGRVAQALGPLHDQGIAHGSLRPELVVDGDGEDVLLGFGVAALATQFGAAGDASQLLPPSYRAPELRHALVPPTTQSDVFALGVLLRDLLSAPESLKIAGKGEPDLSTVLAPGLVALLAQATAAEPRARPSDVRALATELARLAAVETEPVLEASVALSASSDEPAASPNADAALLVPSEPLQAAMLVAPSPLVPVAPPSPFMPATSARQRQQSKGMLIALLVVLGGFTLMVGGVLTAVLVAARHTRPRVAAVSAPKHHAPAPPADPRLTIPGPTDDQVPPVAPTPKKKPAPARPAISHAPLLPPGVGPSTFPEEAHAVLPLLGSEPIWGTRRAPLTWVLFGDLECPHTRHAWRALEATKVTFGDDLRIVFRHRPLREHPYALQAARVLAGLARARGPAAFFAVLHKIAQDDSSLDDERLLAVIQAAGYTGLQVSDLESAGEAVVAADLTLAGQFAVRSTPLSFLNGTRVEGERTPDELERLLLDERRSATWLLATGASANALYVTRTSGNLIGVGAQDTSRVCAPLAGSPTRGPADALVTLVEFSDFECPYCKQVEPTLKTLLARYPRTLRLVWKDYPLPQHKSARLLANFAADAGTRGANAGFWAVHDGLFARSGEVDDGVLGELAGKAGLDGALLLIAAHAGAHDAAIHADVALGERLAVNGTPTFFANGRRIQGALSLEQFDALIRSELASAERIVAHGVTRDKLYRLVCDSDE